MKNNYRDIPTIKGITENRKIFMKMNIFRKERDRKFIPECDDSFIYKFNDQESPPSDMN